ncbi:MAG: RsmE family RNA methyltransferase, partial [Oscillospiraceae bacterium]
MPRFFVPKEDISQEKIILKDENNFHISITLRMRKGEEIVVSDMCSKEYLCVLEEFSKDCCIAKIIKIQSYKSESEQKITLFQCLPKSDKMEQIIKKSTELGVFQIYPVLSKRCISRPDEKSMLKKNER